MVRRDRQGRGRAAAMQPAIVVAALGSLALMPPAQGRMLLIPAGAAAARLLPAAALADGALLVGAGPWPGSLVVETRRPGLPRRMLSRGILATAFIAGGCAVPFQEKRT
ncbi:MAG: hypothetical protein PGN09_00620 [Sphingomonas fennica]